MNGTDDVFIETMKDLKNYVYSTICADQELLADAFPKSHRFLYRSNGELCGVIFIARGPRAVDFTAIWERQNNRVFFYGSDGERYRLTRLTGTIKDWESFYASKDDATTIRA